jgi:outer membrane murein-binding lipoprotein Lpp
VTAHDDLATLGRLLARCVSADEFSPELERLKAHVATLEQERERDKRKVAAYDAARAVVKIEGNTRAYYVLRAEAAEAALADTRRALEDIAKGRWNSRPSVPGWDGTKGNNALLYAQHALRALAASEPTGPTEGQA